MLATFRSALAGARRHGDLYFAALVDRETITAALGETSSLWQGWIYTPAVTVWVFLSQCLSADHSCREAVSRLLAWRVSQGLSPCSPDTGAYCTARDALPEEACRELVRRTGRAVEEQTPPEWLWRGRRVRVVDGSTITMPDTPENQAEYPQAKSQAPGCGLPIARVTWSVARWLSPLRKGRFHRGRLVLRTCFKIGRRVKFGVPLALPVLFSSKACGRAFCQNFQDSKVSCKLIQVQPAS